MNDWIHTRRGVTLVEATLPMIGRGIKRLADLLEAGDVEYEVVSSHESPGPGWKPFAFDTPTGASIWRKRK